MNFAVYSKDGCPYCDKIKQVMDLTKLSYVVYNLNEDFDRDSFYSEFGQGSTFPQVVVDGKKLGGCVDTINSCEKIKSQNNDINKSTDHIDRGFELILSGGKKKRPKSFRLLLDKMISFFNKDINIHLDFYVDVKPKK